jgi:hypothetical protein
MNPWSLAPPVLVAVGNGGNEDVSVVARRVGLKRRDDACAVGVNNLEPQAQQALYFALPNQAIVAQVLEHRPLCIAKTLCRIFLTKSSIKWTSQKSAKRESLLVQAPLSIA